jgi:hypothetical protein
MNLPSLPSTSPRSEIIDPRSEMKTAFMYPSLTNFETGDPATGNRKLVGPPHRASAAHRDKAFSSPPTASRKPPTRSFMVPFFTNLRNRQPSNRQPKTRRVPCTQNDQPNLSAPQRDNPTPEMKTAFMYPFLTNFPRSAIRDPKSEIKRLLCIPLSLISETGNQASGDRKLGGSPSSLISLCVSLRLSVTNPIRRGKTQPHPPIYDLRLTIYVE